MKKKLNSQTAFFNPRFALAVFLCLTGEFIARAGRGLVPPNRQFESSFHAWVRQIGDDRCGSAAFAAEAAAFSRGCTVHI